MSEETAGIETTTQTPEGPSVEEEDFKALFEMEKKTPARLAPGQIVKATVISISGDFVYVDLGGKSEAVIDLAEFRNPDGTYAVKVGDEIEAYFLNVRDGSKRLTTRLRGYSTLDMAGIRDAHQADLPVSGKVKSVIKGGFEVTVGGVRCFCPFSQIDLKKGGDPESYVGQTFPFKVAEFEEDGKNIILSRRSLLKEERDAQVEQFKATLTVGAELPGSVRSILSFGVFVDLGGVDGLIPLSEMGWDRTEKPQDLFTVGQEVVVKVIGIDWEKNRLTLSLKALQDDPWKGVASKYPIDQQVKGTIVRLTPFGAFVNLEPGVDGLLHISNLGAGRRIKHPKEVVDVGQEVEPFVIAVDETNRKISLALELQSKEQSTLPEVGDAVEGTVDQVMSFGIFVRLESGVSGLIPNSEMGTPRGTNHSRMFPPGTKMQVVVIAVDKEKQKITFSRTAVAEKAEHDSYSSYQTAQKGEAGLGSFGELLQRHLQGK
jgi:small subunit ribosomal protein S1